MKPKTVSECEAEARAKVAEYTRPAALPPVRSEPLLAEAIAAIKALSEALERYASVHGADEDDEQALALGRDVMRKANERLERMRAMDESA